MRKMKTASLADLVRDGRKLGVAPVRPEKISPDATEWIDTKVL